MSNPKPPLAVGQRWRRRDGSEVLIDMHDADDDDYPFRADSHWYCANGIASTKRDDVGQIELIKLLEPTPAPELCPRRFVSISRTVLQLDTHALDAIDDDGCAWWMIPGETEWKPIKPLPPR